MRRLRPVDGVGWFITSLGAFLCSALGLVWLMSPLGDGLSRLSYDLLQRWTSDRSAVPKELVIVSMDDRSFVELGQDPTRYWDRSLHTRLIQTLTEQGAKVIAFDVLFNAPDSSKAKDLELAEAMRRHGNVVIASQSNSQTNGSLLRVEEPLLPAEVFLEQATWGSAEFDPDSDGIIRRIRDRDPFVSLARRAAERFGGAPSIRLDRSWLRYFGPAETLHTVSYHDVLKPSALPEGWCRGKIVWVGHGRITPPTNASIPDQFRTPLGLMSGVEIHATLCANLLHTSAWREASPWSELGVILAMGIALGVSAFLRDARKAIGLQLGLIGIVGAWVWVGLRHQQVWSPWLIPAAVQFPFAAAWTAVAHFTILRKENRELSKAKLSLERKLDSYPDHTPAGARLHTLSGAPVQQTSLLIPDYTLIKVIGSGAYGEVWLARSLVGNHVAIKVLFRDRFDDAEPYEREFRGIKRFMSAIGTHPGWVHVLHVGRIDSLSCFYYVMELADDATSPPGSRFDPESYVPKTLRSLLDQRGHLPPTECIELGIALAEALQHLHQEDLIHRDIKPANIIFVRGLPRFADVGLVTTIARPGEELTQVGTLGYVAPEGPGTAVADLYGLGKLLYVCTTGKAVREFPEPPTGLYGREDSPALSGLNDILLKVCETSPDARFKSARSLAEALEQLRHTKY